MLGNSTLNAVIMKFICLTVLLALLAPSIIAGPEKQFGSFSMASSHEDDVRQGLPGRRISGSSRFS